MDASIARFLRHQRSMAHTARTLRHYKDNLRLFTLCLVRKGYSTDMRLYREEGLKLRTKRRTRVVRELEGVWNDRSCFSIM